MIAQHPRKAALFLLPAAAIYGLILLYPLINSVHLSFTDSPAGGPGEWVGLQNYIEMFNDEQVIDALWRTVAYALVVCVMQNAIGLALARALFTRPRAQRVYSVLILLPMLISPLMAAFIWSAFYAPDGAINTFLRDIGLDGLTRIWLGDPDTALWAIAVVNIWMFAGFSAAIFYAGYMNMPVELLDAARIDGAGGFRRFTNIEWPLLAPSLTVNVTLSLIGSLKVFEYPLVMTNGGPAESTTTLTILVYEKIFGGQGAFSYGVTIAVLLLVVVVIMSGLINAVLRRREERI